MTLTGLTLYYGSRVGWMEHQIIQPERALTVQ